VGGAVLTANEVVPARAELVRKALAVFQPAPVVWELDGTTVGDDHAGEFDRILIDAPCTGLGALRRRPEARWRKSPRDVAHLSGLQSNLLNAAITALKPGGILAYVTCSPHLAESKVIVEGAVKKWGDAIERVDTPAVLDTITGEKLDLPETLHAQLWPHRHGTDAMFIQLISKAE
jgi:16S rRNA (cytosine967-C5)-methyltransferase